MRGDRGIKNPGRLGESDVGYPSAALYEGFRRRDLFCIVTGDQANDDIGINGAHDVS